VWLAFGVGFVVIGIGSGTVLLLPLILGLLTLTTAALQYSLDAIHISQDSIAIRTLLRKTVIPTSKLRRAYQLRKGTLFLVFEYLADDGVPRTRRVLALPYVPRLENLRQALTAASPQASIEI
jgi:hypothetical protein